MATGFHSSAPEPLAADKSAARARARALLRDLTPHARSAASAAIRSHLRASAEWMAARTVALFTPLPSEPDLIPLMTAGRRFLFPRIEGTHIELFQCDDLKQMLPNRWGIREPTPEHHPKASPASADLILVPGLAFSTDGSRLGRGGGFYDRLLAELPPSTPRIGVCFAIQLTQHLPRDPHDIAMTRILTEQGPLDPPAPPQR